jgi:hypothetical protein
MNANETTKDVGTRIGLAIARDVLAEGMPRHWTGLEPQDVDQLPEGMDHEEVKAQAKATYLGVLAGYFSARTPNPFLHA